MSNENKIKLAEQVLASHRAKLATTANKDEVRRSISAIQKRIADLKAEAKNV